MSEPQLRASPGVVRGRPMPMPKTYLPNWGVAVVLAAFVTGTYYYSMHAVGSDDMTQELRKEAERQAAEEKSR